MAPVRLRAVRLQLLLLVTLAMSGAAGAQPPANQTPQQKAPVGAPLFGAPRPAVGPPDPTPGIRRATDCPLGYEAPRDKQRIAHLVVCIVKPTNAVALNTVTGPGPRQPGTLSQVPPFRPNTWVNQCAGWPAGSYACGRGGTECCGPKQDNLCFAGAFACYENGFGTGPRKACCMSK